jgi:hypothetical protein
MIQLSHSYKTIRVSYILISNLRQEETRMTRQMLDNRHGGALQEDEYLRLVSEDPRSTGLEEEVWEAKVHTGL